MYLFISFSGDTKKCTDLDDNCEHYVTEEDESQCQLKPDYMMQNCKRSCDFCGPGRNKCVFLICYGHDHITTHLFHLIRHARYDPSPWQEMGQSWRSGENVRLLPMRSGIHFGLLPYVASRVFLSFSGFPPLNKQTNPFQSPWKPPKVKVASSQISLYLFFFAVWEVRIMKNCVGNSDVTVFHNMDRPKTVK